MKVKRMDTGDRVIVSALPRPTERPLRVVFADDPPPAASSPSSVPCAFCTDLQRRLDDAHARIARLNRAVQRDSNQYERRAVHDAHAHVQRNPTR